MEIIHNIILVGDKGVGKTDFKKFISTGNRVSKNIPVLGLETSFILINNKSYGKKSCMSLFKCVKKEFTIIILANANMPTSIDNIPFWYEKMKQKYPSIDINLIVLNIQNCKNAELFSIYHFCSLHEIKLIKL
jgi:hypothetical protein